MVNPAGWIPGGGEWPSFKQPSAADGRVWADSYFRTEIFFEYNIFRAIGEKNLK